MLALIWFTVSLTAPMAMMETSMEPHLAAHPFNMSPGRIGSLFAAFALLAAVVAVMTAQLAPRVGAVRFLICASFLAAIFCFAMTFVNSMLAFSVVWLFTVIGLVPIYVLNMQLMMRLCRTFSLNVADHADNISAASMGALMGAQGFGGTFGGILLSAVGFRCAWRIASVVMLTGPLIFAISLHPRVLKRELAPPAESEQVDSSRSHQVAGEPAKARKQQEVVQEGASEDETGTTGYKRK